MNEPHIIGEVITFIVIALIIAYIVYRVDSSIRIKFNVFRAIIESDIESIPDEYEKSQLKLIVSYGMQSYMKFEVMQEFLSSIISLYKTQESLAIIEKITNYKL